MKRFFNLVMNNMANSIKPMVVLAIVTIVVQAWLYNISLTTRDDYKEFKKSSNIIITIEGEEEYIVCEDPIEFLPDFNNTMFFMLMMVSITVGCNLVASNGREKENNYSILRLLPVSRKNLFIAKIISNVFGMVGICMVNFACITLFYLIYVLKIPQEFRELRPNGIDDLTLKMLIFILMTYTTIPVITAITYGKKNYSIMKGGK